MSARGESARPAGTDDDERCRYKVTMIAEPPEDGLDGMSFELVIAFGGSAIPRQPLHRTAGDRENFRGTAVHRVCLVHGASLEYAKTGCVQSTLKICDIRFHAPLDPHYMDGLQSRSDAIDGVFLPLRTVCASETKHNVSTSGDGSGDLRSRYLEISISSNNYRTPKLIADAKEYLAGLQEAFSSPGKASSSLPFLRYVLLLTRSHLVPPAMGKRATTAFATKMFYSADELLAPDSQAQRLNRPAWKRATALLIKAIFDTFTVPCKVFSYDRVALQSSGRWLEAQMETLPPTLAPLHTIGTDREIERRGTERQSQRQRSRKIGNT